MSGQRIRYHLEALLERMGIPAAIEEAGIPEISIPYVNIVTDEARLLIGSGGEHLTALEHLVKRLLEREAPDGRGAKLLVDVNGYRLRKIEELKMEAKTVARRVRLYRKELPLEPMNPFERRIVHVVLAEYPDIATESTGEGPRRRVVIKPYP